MAELVQALKDEVAYLRAQLVEKDKQIIAMSNASAYRLLHGGAEPPAGPPLPNPNEPYRPQLTLGEIKDNFGN
jgi:hypothetical protein